jgi:hypothetical protein
MIFEFSGYRAQRKVKSHTTPRQLAYNTRIYLYLNAKDFTVRLTVKKRELGEIQRYG